MASNQKTLTSIFDIGFKKVSNCAMRHHFVNVGLMVCTVALPFDAEFGACLAVASGNKGVEPKRITFLLKSMYKNMP